MIRFLFFILLLLTLGFFIQQGAQDSGEAIIRWHGYEIQMKATFLLSVVATFCILFFFGGQLWAFLMQAPHTFERWRYKKRYEQGFDYFLEGMDALSAGEISKAKKLAHKTQNLLPDQRLSNMLSADSASANGQSVKAIEYYKELSKSKKGQFIGLKGLMEQTQKQKDWEELKNYAEQAYLLKPKNNYVVDSLLRANLHLKNFEAVLKLIPTAQKYSSYTSEKLDEYEAFIYIEISHKYEGKEKLKLLEKALKIQKHCVPALILMIKADSSNIKRSLKTISNFFYKTANLAVYECWSDIMNIDDHKYYKRRFKSFLKGKDATFISYLVQGKEFMRTDKYKQALEMFKQARDIVVCKQVDILIATAASSVEGCENEVKRVLNNLNDSKNHIFEGDEIIQAYKHWQEKYIVEEHKVIEKPKRYLNLLSKK